MRLDPRKTFEISHEGHLLLSLSAYNMLLCKAMNGSQHCVNPEPVEARCVIADGGSGGRGGGGHVN